MMQQAFGFFWVVPILQGFDAIPEAPAPPQGFLVPLLTEPAPVLFPPVLQPEPLFLLRGPIVLHPQPSPDPE